MSTKPYNHCPVCLTEADVHQGNGDYSEINCPRCGRFKIAGTAEPMASNEHGKLGPKNSRCRGDLSAWLRENENRDIMVSTYTFDEQSSDPDRLGFETARDQVQTFHDRADKLLRFLEKKTEYAGQNLEQETAEWTARAWALNYDELNAIIGFLVDSRRINELANGLYEMAPDGWLHLEKLKETNPESQQGFLAMWFDDSMDKVWKEAFEPAIEEAGYRPLRIDKKPHANRIDDQIIAEIRQSRFLVADLTEHRGGVYYEAGFAQGLKLPVFWTCRKDEAKEIHFDTRQFNRIIWQGTEEGLEKLKDDLRDWIAGVLGWGTYKPEVGTGQDRPAGDNESN